MMARNNFLFVHCAIVNNSFLLFFLENEEENGSRNTHKVHYKVVFLKKLFVLTKSNELVCKDLQLMFLQNTTKPKRDTKLYLWCCIRKEKSLLMIINDCISMQQSLLIDNRWLFSCTSIVHLRTKRCINIPLRICETTCVFHRFSDRFARKKN
jgi:hypothetical protein